MRIESIDQGVFHARWNTNFMSRPPFRQKRNISMYFVVKLNITAKEWITCRRLEYEFGVKE
jgi:hypothetical protein